MEDQVINTDKYNHKIGEPWTVSELAEASNLSGGRIRQLIADKTIKSFLRVKHLRLVSYLDGIAFLESRENG